MRALKFLVTNHGAIHVLELGFYNIIGSNLEAYASEDRTVWTQLPVRVAVSIEAGVEHGKAEASLN